MKYLYYPGCSLKGSGRPYEESLLRLLDRLGVEVAELAHWNCCGATAYMSVDEVQAFALAARNLCLAEACGGPGDAHLIAPCSACYLVLNKAQVYIRQYARIGQVVAEALRAAGLEYHGRIKVRHPLDVLFHDVGVERIKKAVTRPLQGLKVACYYGCQVVRPYATFDNPYNPMVMDHLLRAAGAQTVDWSLKARCCGGTLTGTMEEAGLRLSYILLKEARAQGAQVVATACPLCQFNLECYQDRMQSRFGDGIEMPVAYFTQLLGMAMGIPAGKLGMERLLAPQPAIPAGPPGAAAAVKGEI